jgi:alkanesulfonate monooxygenase SsuD/methylene tetrahydromethanopterin reductase-like flavin-dependent oxidoreductase (luciferase family)
MRSLGVDGLKVSDGVRQQAEEAIQRFSQRRWEELIEDSLLIGSPATIRARVAELESAGVGELVCWMNFGGLPSEQVRRSMRMFANEVMPAFKAVGERPSEMSQAARSR